jgi:hypothetical protein
VKTAACVIAAFLALPPIPALADDAKLQLYEQTIKAGLVYNFLKYTTWPAAAEKSRLRVCLLGSDALADSLSPLQGRTAQASVISIARIDDVQDTAGCSLVFIGRSEEDRLSGLLTALKDRHVLTVSDISHFARAGGMIEMASEDSRVTLYINKEAVDRAGLLIEGRMLKLAKPVSG